MYAKEVMIVLPEESEISHNNDEVPKIVVVKKRDGLETPIELYRTNYMDREGRTVYAPEGYGQRFNERYMSAEWTKKTEKEKS